MGKIVIENRKNLLNKICSDPKNICDKKRVVDTIEKSILGKNMYSDREISNVLCCYKECIENNGGTMNYLIIKEIVELLGCVIDRYNRDILIEKYTN